ncbi:MAG: hypothetical protein FWG10_11635 [Eubacteriaceae bacterium]|nr:hypothetical protein [Eubacteriaceae bacterium]
MFYAKGADGGHCPAVFQNRRLFAAIIENGVKKNYTGHDERSAFEEALEEPAMPERTINGRRPGSLMLAIDSKSIKNCCYGG